MKHGSAALTRLWHMAMAVVVIAGLIAVVGPQQQASAAGQVGRGTAESCTEAALNAALLGSGLVSFNCGDEMATITVTGEKVITRNTRIVGNWRVTISGGNTTRVFRVEPGVSLELETITVANGFVTDATGAGIQNNGTLTLTYATVSSNRIAGRADGAGVFNSGTLTVTGGLFTRNQGTDSGGLGNVGTATITGTTFEYNVGNWGGAIVNRGNMTINSSTILENSANNGYGAGLYTNGGTTNVNNSFFGWNGAYIGAGVFVNGGEVTLYRTTLTGNTASAGAGAYNMHGRLNVDSSSFLGNIASDSGGGIALGGGWPYPVGGTVGIVNSTFSGNTANYGAGMVSYGENESTIAYSTFSGNDAQTAGGGFYQLYGTMKMTGVVFASVGGNCSGIEPVSDGYNLSSDSTCGFSQPSDKLATDPLLHALADNGGPTRTHAPAAGSPLIEGGAASCYATDQRGVNRPNGGACDIGAVEGEAPADTTAPVATAPVETFYQRRGAVSETSIKVGLIWSATNEGYGVARYELERAVNGGAWLPVTLADNTQVTHAMTLYYNKSHQFRVRAIDNAGNVGAWAEAAAFDIRRVEETNAAVAYKGVWTSVTSSAASGGTLKHSKTAGYTATLAFEGNAVAWISELGTNRGKAHVYIDGAFYATVDLYAAKATSRQLVWQTDGLADGPHSLRIRIHDQKNTASSSTRVDVSGFIVLD